MKINPKKSLGQNFLIDNNLLELIADLAKINSEDTVLEVGPGTGNLTEKLIQKKPKKIIGMTKQNKIIISNFFKSCIFSN